MVLLVVMCAGRLWARSISGSVRSIVIISPYGGLQLPIESVDDSEHLQRNKREAYDPYSQYYYYPSSLNPQDAPQEFDARLDRRDSDGQTAQLQNGNKYKYTPLFQYKSTQAKRRKLFVPNLFG